MEKTGTIVKEGHLLHIGPVSEGLHTDGLTTTLRGAYFDHAQLE